MSKRSEKYQWLKEWEVKVGEGGTVSGRQVKEFYLGNLNEEAVKASVTIRKRSEVLLRNGKEMAKPTVQEPKPIESLTKIKPQALLEEGVVMNDKRKVLDALEWGAKLDVPGCRGYTPLNDAVDRKNREMVDLLVKLGANVNQRDENGATALDHAICKKYWDLVACLIGLGAEVNNVNDANETPLIEALSKHAPFTIIRMLLNADADPCYKGGDNDESPVELAFRIGSEEVRKLFQDRPKVPLGKKEYVNKGVFQNSVFVDTKKKWLDC